MNEQGISPELDPDTGFAENAEAPQTRDWYAENIAKLEQQVKLDRFRGFEPIETVKRLEALRAQYSLLYGESGERPAA